MQVSQEQRNEWTLLMELRNQGTLQLDQLKKQVGLNKAGEAEIIYEVKDPAQRRDWKPTDQTSKTWSAPGFIRSRLMCKMTRQACGSSIGEMIIRPAPAVGNAGPTSAAIRHIPIFRPATPRRWEDDEQD